MTEEELFQDAEFLEWFNDRPASVQEVIRKVPPCRKYIIEGGIHPGQILSYDEHDDGRITVEITVESPLLPRRVFGVDPDSLIPWTDPKDN